MPEEARTEEVSGPEPAQECGAQPPAATPPAPFSMAGASIIGTRTEQEDAFRMAPAKGGGSASSEGCIVLADGVGGAADGHLASNAVADAAVAALNLRTCSMYEVAQDANGKLKEAKARGEMHQDACSTLIALAYGGNAISWASVGDSLLLLQDSAGGLVCLNKRHTHDDYLREQLEQHLISKEEYEEIPQSEKKAIYSCIDGGLLEYVDEGERELRPGERVIIASDGLLALGRQGIEDCLAGLRDAPAQSVVEALIQRVEGLGASEQDNTTLVVLDYAPDASAPTQRQEEENGTPSGFLEKIHPAALFLLLFLTALLIATLLCVVPLFC